MPFNKPISRKKKGKPTLVKLFTRNIKREKLIEANPTSLGKSFSGIKEVSLGTI